MNRLNKQHRPVNWAMLTLYAEGRLDDKGHKALQLWLQEHPDHEQILAEVTAIYERDRRLDTTEKYKHYQTAPALEKFLGQIAAERPVERKVWTFFKISAAAAGLLLLLCISYFFLNRGGLYRNGAGKTATATVISWKTIVSGRGRVVNITLADGSTVRLAPGSRLQYPESFGSTGRMVKLEGEAFFEVTKDPARPFVVQTRTIATRVLGTSFNIEAYGHQLFSKVTLLTGKIAIGRVEAQATDSVLAVLVPNESITVSNEDSTFSVSKIKPAGAEAIKEGKLVFDGATMKEVAYKLELHYGIKVYLENTAVESVVFTGTFGHIALSQLTGMIAEATGLSMEQKGDNLYISGLKTK